MLAYTDLLSSFGEPTTQVAAPIHTMTAQTPYGTSATVPPPTMTPAGPMLSPPTSAAIHQAPLGTVGMTGGAAPSLNTTVGTPEVPVGAPGSVSAPSGTPHPFAAPTGAAPGATAPGTSLAALAMMPPPTGAQLAPGSGPAPAPTGATGTPQVTGTGSAAVQSTPLTGQEAPKTIDPTLSPALQALLAKAQEAATRAVDQPTVWDDTLAKSITDAQKRGINENYTGAQDSLDAELAGRGINFSSIAGSRNVDLATRRAQELSSVDTNIARERANALASGRASGLSGLQSVLGATHNIETGVQDAARGERNYTDATAQQAHNQALEEMVLGHSMSMQDQAAWQSAVQQGLNYGTNGAGTSALTAAGGVNSATGAAYGGQASSDNAGLSSLMQLAMQYFGGK